MKRIKVDSSLTHDSILMYARGKMKIGQTVRFGNDIWRKIRPCKDNDYTAIEQIKRHNADLEPDFEIEIADQI